MNNQEAIEQLKFDMDMITFDPHTGEEITLEQVKDRNEKNYETYLADEIAIKALEKQVAKKPILKSGQSVVHVNRGDKPHEMRVDKWQDWCCPVCGWFVGQRYNIYRHDGSAHPHDQRKSDYCNECGQKIDWSNEAGEK